MTIFIAISMVLGALGTWRALRRHPRYSERSDLKILGGLVLVVGVVIAASVWIPSLWKEDSPARVPVLTASLVAVIALAVGGLSAFALRVSEGPATKLPPSARRVDVHRRKLHPWCWWAGVGIAAWGGTAVATSSPMLLLPGALFFLMVCSALAPLYLKAGRYDRGATALMAEPWVHWRYAPDEWQAWADSELARLRTIPKLKGKHDGLKLLFPFLIAGGTLWFVAEGSTADKLGIAGVGLVSLTVLVSVGVLWGRGHAQRQHRKLIAGAPEAYFGSTGVLFAGVYAPWIWANRYLKTASRHSAGRAHLTFVFDINAGRGYRQLLHQHVPIPADGDRDLDLLSRKLRECFPQAVISVAGPSS